MGNVISNLSDKMKQEFFQTEAMVIVKCWTTRTFEKHLENKQDGDNKRILCVVFKQILGAASHKTAAVW